MTKTGFKDPIAPPPTKEKKSPWDFRAPCYDERSSCYIAGGSHYGVGYTNPVGHKGAAKQRVDTMPFGRPKTMQTTHIPYKKLEQEFVE